MFAPIPSGRVRRIRVVTRERVRVLLEQGMTISEIAETLALANSTVCYHARQLGHPPDERFAVRHDWPAIRLFYERGFSMRECTERFGFHRSAWFEAVRRGAIVPRSEQAELEIHLRKGSNVSRRFVKQGLIRVGLKSSSCERCGLAEWRDTPLQLALHHVNGDGTDHRLVNLQLLCPNCHSQTPNFAGRNVKKRVHA